MQIRTQRFSGKIVARLKSEVHATPERIILRDKNAVQQLRS